MVRLAARRVGIAVVINTMVVFASVCSEGWKERKADELYWRSRHPSQHA